MRKLFVILVFLTTLFSPSASFAMNRFERFLLGNPGLFRLQALAVAVGAVVVMFLYNYLLARKETDVVRRRLVQQKSRGKEVSEREKAYEKIPRGPIGDVSLPPAKLVQVLSKTEYEISSIHELTIGRSVENIVVVERASVSRNHAKIRPEKQGYVLYDLLSTVGTYVNDEKIMKHVLKDGDVVGIAREDFMFKL